MPDEARPNIPACNQTKADACQTIIIHRSGLMREGLTLTLARSKFKVTHSAPYFDEDFLASRVERDPRLMIIGANPDFAETVDQIVSFKLGGERRVVGVLVESNELAFKEAALLLNAGASGLFSRGITSEALIKCLEMIVLGELVVSQQFMNAILGRISTAAQDKIRFFEKNNPLAGFIIMPDRLTG